MIKFNDNNIITGCIKQILTTFNLPSLRVYTEDSFLYERALYIKDNYIYKYTQGELKPFIPFNFNKPILNYTKNLKITNLIYDSHTHEYLGDYLRFLRDYKHLDLMSMYNCFSDNVVHNLNMQWTTEDNKQMNFNTQSEDFNIYCLPVKLNKKYTIAISSDKPFEIVCGLYSKSLLENPELNNATYQVITNADFNSPIIYDKLTNDSLKTAFLYEHESDLKMFIKLSSLNTTSVCILEGEYLNTNTQTVDEITKTWKNSSNTINYRKEENIYKTEKHKVKYKNAQGQIVETTVTFPNTVTAYDATTGKFTDHIQYWTQSTDNDKLNDLRFNSKLQLLQMNSNVSYPFADRLIEYLLDNAITNIENIPDNIKRVQKELIRRREVEDGQTKKVGLSDYKYYGLWEPKYKGIGYDIAVETNIINTEFDVLGYIDKDIESKLGADYDIYEGE